MSQGPVQPNPVTWQDLQAYFPGSLRIGTFIRPLPDHNVVYVKNPKAGCSTIMVWLDRIHTGELDREFTNIHRQHRLPSIADVGRNRVLQMVRGEAYRFTFVRHPVRRFESVYADKLASSSVHRTQAFRRRVQRTLEVPEDPQSIPTFEEFLTAVEQQDPVAEMDPHWRPQHINLMHPDVTYDHVGRLESFDADMMKVRDESGLPDVPYRTRNASSGRRGASVFDGRPDLVTRVEQLYATDMELYGY